ncbi:MAG: GAF domain-containing protein, partial [Proteobacteria bacterium]|nr:GAF domain-containing protein [Pseudomonadota bacterium]
LNLQASKKAKKSNAYRPAFEYARVAKALLPEDAWDTSYDHCFEIHQEYAESAYLSIELEVAGEITKLLLDKAKTNLEKASIYQMQIRQLVTSGKNEETVPVGIKGLSLLGIKVSMKPSPLIILKELGLAKWNLGKRSVESLIDMPLMKDAEKLTAMKIMDELSPSCYLLGLENLFAVLVLKRVNLALRFGNSSVAANCYVMYAMALNGIFGDFKTSYEFGKLAVKVNEKLDDLEFRCQINFLYSTFIHSWNHHWKSSFPFYQRGMEAGLQSGDLLYTVTTASLMLKLFSHLPLSEVSKLGERNLQIFLDSKYPDSLDFGNILQGYHLNLMGKTNDRFTLSHANFDEDECLASIRQRKFLMGISVFLVAKLELYYLYENFDEGIKLVPELGRIRKTIMSTAFDLELCFYAFMTHATLCFSMTKKKQSQALKGMKKEYKQMRKWNDHYPVNSSHLVYMMESEFAQIKNDNQVAITCLEKAIDAAMENEFLQYKALANKLLGKLYLSLDKKKIAGLYLTDAYYDYQMWGATRVLEFLKEKYGAYLDLGALQRQSVSKQTQTLSSTSGTRTNTKEKGGIDLGTVTKAAQAISGEVVLNKLLTRLMQTVRENAGAEKAILLEAQGLGNDLLIQAKSLGDHEIEVLMNEQPGNSDQLSQGIVNYVARSLENVVLGEAGVEGDFTHDPYIQSQGPKSVLCMPILNHGKLVGVLYL